MTAIFIGYIIGAVFCLVQDIYKQVKYQRDRTLTYRYTDIFTTISV